MIRFKPFTDQKIFPQGSFVCPKLKGIEIGYEGIADTVLMTVFDVPTRDALLAKIGMAKAAEAAGDLAGKDARLSEFCKIAKSASEGGLIPASTAETLCILAQSM